MVTKKTELHTYITLAVLLTLIPALFYVYKFWTPVFSKDTTLWANFADYFAGLTTPILSILNLIVLVRLTLSISDSDNQRMLTQLRYDAYKDITIKLNGINKENYNMEKVNAIYYYFENYALNNFFLLEGNSYKILTEMHLKLWKIICKIKVDLEDFENRHDKSKLYNTEEFAIELKSELENKFIDFDVTKFEILSFLEKTILGRPIDNFSKRYLKE